jgi:hypothetical protein
MHYFSPENGTGSHADRGGEQFGRFQQPDPFKDVCRGLG